jgi:RNA polymerase sigma-70 factor (ECF subfamily)
VATKERDLESGATRADIDLQLVQASLRDRQLFWRLYERYVDPIYWYALPRTRSAAAADDIVSETMLAAFEHLESFDPQKGSFATWLFVIARRKIIDQQRAHRRFWRYVRSRAAP